MTLAATAARGGLITLASQIFKIVILLCSTIVLGRLLTPSDFGLVAMVVVIVGFGEIVRDFGLSMAALQAKHLSQGQQSNLFWLNTAVGAVLTAVVFFSATVVANFYGQPQLTTIIQILSLTFILGGMSTQFKVSINRDLRFAALAMIDIAPALVGLICAVTVALLGGGYWALVVQYLVVPSVGLLTAVLIARWFPGLPKRVPMGDLLKFGASFAGTQLISYATRNVDSIVIGRVQGAVQLGYYDRAYQLVMMPINQINTPMSRVAVPILARLTDDADKYMRFLRKSQLIALYVTAGIFSVVAGIGDLIVVIVLGEQWRQAGTILQILAIGAVFRSLVQVCYWVYMSRGLAHRQLKYFLVTQPVLTLFIVSGVVWGIRGVAAAHSIGFAVYWFVSVLWMGKVSGLKVLPLLIDAGRAVLIFCAPAGLISFIVARVTIVNGDYYALICACAAALVWFGLVFVVYGGVRRDLLEVISFARAAVAKS